MAALAQFEDAAGELLGTEWPHDDYPVWRQLGQDEAAARRAFLAEYGPSD